MKMGIEEGDLKKKDFHIRLSDMAIIYSRVLDSCTLCVCILVYFRSTLALLSVIVSYLLTPTYLKLLLFIASNPPMQRNNVDSR